MSEFEDYIKARYPVDYDSLKEKYPNVHVCEFYGDEQDLWDLKQAEIDDLEKQLDMMKYINDEQNKNLTNALKTIEVQQKFDVDSQGAIAHLTEMNNRYLGKMQEQQDTIASAKAVIKKHDRYIPHSTVEALEKALRGEHE